MQKLLEQNTVPPDGFRFFQAETKTWIRAPDYFNLFFNVSEHRKANNLPLGTFWEAEVEDQLCQALPPGLCKQVKPGEVRNVFSRISWDEVVGGTQTIVDWAKSGFAHVDQTLANSRASVCAGCYYNVQVGGLCAACQHLQNLAARFTGGRKTTSDPWLKACSVCKCSLQVKVWTPIESIDKGTKDLDPYPNFCWIKKELTALRSAKV